MERCSVWEGIRIEEGCLGDYELLKGFHYRGGRPGGVVRVWRAIYEGNAKRETRNAKRGEGVLAGVVVEALPSLGCEMRGVALSGRYEMGDRRLSAALLNREVRCISRVVVEPRFRGVGLAVALVRRVLEAEGAAEGVKYVEALAAMGRVNPFFERAGMRRYERPMGREGVRLVGALELETRNMKRETRNGGEGAEPRRHDGATGVEEARNTDHETRNEGDNHEDTKGGKTHEGDGGIQMTPDESDLDVNMFEWFMDLREEGVSSFLAGELRRFCRRRGTVGEMLAEARGRLFSWPVYYLAEVGKT